MLIRKVIGLFFLCSLQQYVFAATYYVSSTNGNDNNSGLTASSPWRSLSKVNTMMGSFNPGDEILLKRNDIFRGQLTVTASGAIGNPIKFGAYDIGNKPLILGSENIADWTMHTSQIQKSTPQNFSNVFQLYIADTWQTPARYPNGNENFLSIDSVNNGSSRTTFADNQLSGLTFSLNGAICLARTARFTFERRTISSHQPGSEFVTVSSAIAHNSFKKGWGYFLTNKLEFLDAGNEWFYDTTTKEIFIFGSTAPANVEATVYPYGIYVPTDGASDIVIENISFKYQQLSGIAFWRNNNRCIVQDCEFNYAGESAINVYRVSNGILLQRNKITNSLNRGISAYNPSSMRIIGNDIQDCGLIPGYAGPNHLDLNDLSLNNFTLHNGTGISIWEAGSSTRQNQIVENKITNTCYSGIQLRSYNSLVTKNVINNYCKFLDDGGGIYVRFSGNKISNNIVSNGLGNLQWTTDTWLGTSGIYLDDLTSIDTILDNTSTNANTALYLHNSRLNVISGNVLYNCNTQLEVRDDDLDGIGDNCDGNKFTGNIFYCLNRQSISLKMYTSYSSTSLENMGALWDSNYFFNPYSYTHINTRSQSPSIKNENISFTHWKNIYAPQTTSLEGFFKSHGYIILNEGGNLIANGDMEIGNPPSSWTKFSGVTHSRGTNNLLDNYSLEVLNSSANPGRTISNILNFEKDQHYLLRFSTAANANGYVRAYPLQSNVSYANGPDYEQVFPFTTTRNNYETIFKIVRDNQSGNMFFANDLQYPSYFLDNVSLTKVTVTEDDPLERSRLYVNATSSPVNITISDTRTNLDNVVVHNQISIPAFSSTILIKSSNVVLSNKSIELTSKLMSQNNSVQLTWRSSDPKNITHYVILKSNGRQDFLPIKSMISQTNTPINTYTDKIMDGNDLYYQIQSLDKSGQTQLSNIVHVQGVQNLKPDNFFIANNSLFVNYHSEKVQTAQLEFFNPDGKNLYSTEFKLSQGDNNLEISFPRISASLIIARIIIGNKQYVIKSQL